MNFNVGIMKVYLVSVRIFFKDNNTDYAMAFDPKDNNDLKLFINYDDAKNAFNNSCKFYRDNFHVTEEDISCNNELTIIFYNKYHTARYIVSLIEKEVR